MSRFNHSLCDRCWTELEPDRQAVKIREPSTETCCQCGDEHKSGIYYRANPDLMPCKGIHDDNEPQEVMV